MRKKLFIISLFAAQLFIAQLKAQNKIDGDSTAIIDSSRNNKERPDTVKSVASKDYHVHHGFHIEFGAAPAFGTITEKIEGHEIFRYSGTGIGIEFKAGAAVKRNLFVTLDILYKTMISPKIIFIDPPIEVKGDNTISETILGAGITYYTAAKDFFLSATAGGGKFNVAAPYNAYNEDKKYGISGQVKAGKHWWVADEAGISLGVAYGFTIVKFSKYDYGSNYTVNGKLISDRLTIVASVGFH